MTETGTSYEVQRAAIEAKRRILPHLTKRIVRLYHTRPAAHQVFHDFVWNHVGELHPESDQPVIGLAADPEIEAGGFSVRKLAKYTSRGNLVVVRHRPAKHPAKDDYYVAQANMTTGETRRWYLNESPVWSNGQEHYFLTEDAEPKLTVVRQTNTGEAMLDMFTDMDAAEERDTELATQPCIAIGNGSYDSFYRGRSTHLDLFADSIDQFRDTYLQFCKAYGQIPVGDSIEIPQPDTLAM